MKAGLQRQYYESRIAEAEASIEYNATAPIQPSLVLKSRENVERGRVLPCLPTNRGCERDRG
jgi:hypothetical protein